MSDKRRDGDTGETPGADGLAVTRRRLIMGGAAVSAGLAAAYVAPRLRTVRAVTEPPTSPTPTSTPIPPTPPTIRTPDMMVFFEHLATPPPLSGWPPLFEHRWRFVPNQPTTTVFIQGTTVPSNPNEVGRIEVEIVSLTLGGIPLPGSPLVVERLTPTDPMTDTDAKTFSGVAGQLLEARVRFFATAPDQFRHYYLTATNAQYFQTDNPSPVLAENGNITWYFNVGAGDGDLEVNVTPNTIAGVVPPMAGSAAIIELYDPLNVVQQTHVTPVVPFGLLQPGASGTPGFWKLVLTGLDGHHVVERISAGADMNVYTA